MQIQEFVIITYGHLSESLVRPLECPICRKKTTVYVTASTELVHVPLYCGECQRTFVTDFRNGRQKSVI